MSIWDDITKGVSDAASFTVKKTGEITGLAKIKYALHSEKSKLAECFEEIGKLYYAYQREGTDYSAEIAALIAEADVIKMNIAELNDEAAKLKNLTLCPECGAKVDDSMVFCPTCGKKLEKAEPECECDDPDEIIEIDDTDDTDAE